MKHYLVAGEGFSYTSPDSQSELHVILRKYFSIRYFREKNGNWNPERMQATDPD